MQRRHRQPRIEMAFALEEQSMAEPSGSSPAISSSFTKR